MRYFAFFKDFEQFCVYLTFFLSICIAFVNFFNYTTVLVVIFVNKEF